MRGFLLLTAALGLTLLSGCNTVVRSYVVIGRTGPATHRAAEIRLASGPLPLGFEEVAVMQVQVQGADAEPGFVRGELAWIAGQLGCNLMIEISLDQGTRTVAGVALAARTPVSSPPTVVSAAASQSK